MLLQIIILSVLFTGYSIAENGGKLSNDAYWCEWSVSESDCIKPYIGQMCPNKCLALNGTVPQKEKTRQWSLWPHAGAHIQSGQYHVVKPQTEQNIHVPIVGAHIQSGQYHVVKPQTEQNNHVAVQQSEIVKTDQSLPQTSHFGQVPSGQLTNVNYDLVSKLKYPANHLECGLVKSNEAISNKDADMHEYPWHVAFYHKYGFACEGVLISDMFILTTSSCMKSFINAKKAELVITIGDHDLTTDSETDSLKIHARTLIRHAKYEETVPLNNDVALVELEEPVTFSKKISPVCLPNPMEDYKHNFAVIPSWGRSSAINTLQESEVKLMLNDDCKQVASRDWLYRVVQPGQLCSLPRNMTDGIHSCTSTRGAGLVIQEDRHWILIGLVSSSRGCGGGSQPQLNVRLQDYVDWIKTNANIYTMCRNGATTKCETVND